MPFWWNDRPSPDTFLYAALLALLAAAIVGVVPALKATGPQMQARLKEAAAGGSTEVRRRLDGRHRRRSPSPCCSSPSSDP